VAEAVVALRAALGAQELAEAQPAVGLAAQVEEAVRAAGWEPAEVRAAMREQLSGTLVAQVRTSEELGPAHRATWAAQTIISVEAVLVEATH
jgi:hypothetical protein